MRFFLISLAVAALTGLLSSCEKKTEVTRSFYDNGVVRRVDYLDGAGRLVEVRTFHINGIRQSRTAYRQNVRQGSHQEWRSDGALDRSGDYAHDTTTGIWREWYEDRKVRSKGVLSNDIRQGLWEDYHPDGSLAGRRIYKAGQPSGLWEFWDPKGRTLEKNSCHALEQNGLVERWDTTGLLLETGRCEFGKKVGVWETYHRDGTPHLRSQWARGVADQVWTWRRRDGSVYKQESWSQGLRHGNFGEWGGAGDTLLQGRFQQGSGIVQRWCARGVLCAESLWVGGVLDGRVFYIDTAQGVHSEEIWKAGDKRVLQVYRRGQLVRKGSYAEGRPHGIWRTWWPSGILRDSLNYQSGELWGPQFYHDSTGILVKREMRHGKRGVVLVELARPDGTFPEVQKP